MRFAVSVLCVSITLVFFACNKGDDDGGNDRETRLLASLEENFTEIRTLVENGEDAFVACAASLDEAEPLLEGENEDAKAAVEELQAFCGLDVPVATATAALAEARTALAEGGFTTATCSIANTALADIAESQAEAEAAVAIRQEVLELCGMEVHLSDVRGHIEAGQASIQGSETTISAVGDCSMANSVIGRVDSALAEHEQVVALRQQINELCQRDQYVAGARAYLDRAAASRAADPSAMINMDCRMARNRIEDIDAAFAADPAVTAIQARVVEVCGE